MKTAPKTEVDYSMKKRQKGEYIKSSNPEATLYSGKPDYEPASQRSVYFVGWWAILHLLQWNNVQKFVLQEKKGKPSNLQNLKSKGIVFPWISIWLQIYFFSGQLDFISIDSRENRILYFSNEADLDETLVIRKPLLKRWDYFFVSFLLHWKNEGDMIIILWGWHVTVLTLCLPWVPNGTYRFYSV